jgi:hypothetical protein
MKMAMHDRSAPERIAVGLRLSPTRWGMDPKSLPFGRLSRARGVSAEDQLRPVIRGHCCGRQNWIERRASTIDSLAFTCLNGQKRQALAPGFAIALTGCALAWGWEEHRCTRKSVSRGVCPATGTFKFRQAGREIIVKLHSRKGGFERNRLCCSWSLRRTTRCTSSRPWCPPTRRAWRAHPGG